jgi:hypothetical protein
MDKPFVPQSEHPTFEHSAPPLVDEYEGAYLIAALMTDAAHCLHDGNGETDDETGQPLTISDWIPAAMESLDTFDVSKLTTVRHVATSLLNACDEWEEREGERQFERMLNAKLIDAVNAISKRIIAEVKASDSEAVKQIFASGRRRTEDVEFI